MAGRVVLAMSGGVDSSVCAQLLKAQGYEVIGLFMRTGVHPGGANDTRRDNKKGCCSAVDATDARRVADRLDIPFYALDFEAEFGKIVDYFADEYLARADAEPVRGVQQLAQVRAVVGLRAKTRRGPGSPPGTTRGSCARRAAARSCTAARTRIKISRMSCMECGGKSWTICCFPSAIWPSRR